MAAEHSVGFEPADRLAKDRERAPPLLAQAEACRRASAVRRRLACCLLLRVRPADPRHVQASLLGAIAYFILPFDFVADVMPILGFADDAAVLATAIRMVAGHITNEHREAARAALKRELDEAEAAQEAI